MPIGGFIGDLMSDASDKGAALAPVVRAFGLFREIARQARAAHV